jgi:hypothetical protein
MDLSTEQTLISVHPQGPGIWALAAQAPGIYPTTINWTCRGQLKTQSPLVVEVLQSPKPMIIGQTKFCKGTRVNLSTGSYASYLWSTGSQADQIEVEDPGIYSVTVTASNRCTGSDSLELKNYPEIEGDIEVQTQYKPDTCLIRFVPKDSNQSLSYLWSNGSTSDRIESGAGTIRLTVTDNNGCQKNFEGGCIPSALNEEPGQNGILVFPNPASDQVHLKSPWPFALVIVQSLEGKVLSIPELNFHSMLECRIGLRGLAPGLYVLRVYGRNGELGMIRLVVW